MLCLSQHIRSSEGLEVQTIFPDKKKRSCSYISDHNNVDGTQVVTMLTLYVLYFCCLCLRKQ